MLLDFRSFSAIPSSFIYAVVLSLWGIILIYSKERTTVELKLVGTALQRGLKRANLTP